MQLIFEDATTFKTSFSKLTRFIYMLSHLQLGLVSVLDLHRTQRIQLAGSLRKRSTAALVDNPVSVSIESLRLHRRRSVHVSRLQIHALF